MKLVHCGINYLLINFLINSGIISEVISHTGHHYSPFISKKKALSVNCDQRFSVECCRNKDYEHWCEESTSKTKCREVNESGREEQCILHPCSAGQTCYLEVACASHYKRGCSDDPCLAYPCAHDGTCTNSGTNKYVCTCKPGYDPVSNCVKETNECNSNPCQNGATCMDHFNQYTCTCAPGFTGYNCQIDINECSSNPCQNGATCNDFVNFYTCTCIHGYTGVTCQIDINECDSSPCQNGATCNDFVNFYTCTCVPGYTDVNCQTNTNECSSNPCQNSATCNDLVNFYSCTCVPGYTGVNCQANINECSSNPCQNGATCNDFVNYYTCTCVPGYTGVNCQTEIDECDSSPCQNGATCHDFFNNYKCSCLPGYSGVNCQTDINECMSDPCKNGGSCSDLVNHYTCDCTDRFNGTVCEKDCRPGPVDMLFVVDVSTSSVNECRKSFDFMTSIVTQLPIGPDDFQIAVITYSFRPVLHWNFTSFYSNDALVKAIADLQCEGGATYTGKALQFAEKIFRNTQYGTRNSLAFQQVILITDGMSSDPRLAIKQSWDLTLNNVKLYVIGVGHYVDHLELQSLAHSPDYVFSTLDHDVLQRLYLETAHPDCNDCIQTTTSDIIFLLDTSSVDKAKYSTKAAISLIKYLDNDNSDIQIGVFSYSGDVTREIQLASYTEYDLLTSISNVIIRNTGAGNIARALNISKGDFIQHGRIHSKQLLVVFTDGKYENKSLVKDMIRAMPDPVSVMLVGMGDDVDYAAIRDVVTNPYYAILTVRGEDFRPLQTLKSEISSVNCVDDIFRKRQ